MTTTLTRARNSLPMRFSAVVTLLFVTLTDRAVHAQTDRPGPVLAPIVRTERVGAGVVRVVYDLNGAAGTFFTVTLEASNDGGRTFAIRPQATTGDVGASVAAGPGKAIEWDSTKDIDDLQLDRYVFRVFASPVAPPAEAVLRIVILEGQGAVNTIRRPAASAAGAAVTPLVEVRNRNDLPVSGAAVTFSLGGRTATFSNGSSTLTVTTGADGRARATGINPVSPGVVRMTVQATYQGGVAEATIEQANVEQRAAASSGGSTASGKTGSGLSRGKVIGIAGGVAAGVGVAIAKRTGGTATSSSTPGSTSTGNGPAPALVVTALPSGIGIREVTEFSFAAFGDSGATFSWNFGDGGVATGASVTHTYGVEGTFQVTVKSGTGAGERIGSTTVMVGNLTGSWNRNPGLPSDICCVFRIVLIQQSGSIAGEWRITGAGTNRVYPASGSIASPRTVTIQQNGECNRVYTATVDAQLTRMTGTYAYMPNTGLCGPEGTQAYTRE